MNLDYRRQYEEFFNSLPDGAFVADAKGDIRMINASGAHALGFERPDELIGSPLTSLYANPSDHDAMLSVLGHKGRTDKSIFDWKRKNGEPMLVEITARPLRDADGKIHGIQGVFRDISKRLESQIAQQETLAETAARGIDETRFLEAVHFYQSRPLSLYLQGVAHNLNTPLGSIRGRAELMQHHIKKNSGRLEAIGDANVRKDLEALLEKVVKGIADIIGQVDRASQLIQGFAGKISMEVHDEADEVDLNDLVRREIAFLESSLYFKHKIQKTLTLADHLPVIKTTYAPISHAFHYLIIDAMMAMARGEERTLGIRTYARDGGACIVVSDSRSAGDASMPFSERSRDNLPDEAFFSAYAVEHSLAELLLRSIGGEMIERPNGVEIFVPAPDGERKP